MPDKFFISYSRVDTEFVLKLANDLKYAGVNVWLDQLNISPGAHWDNEIEAALNSATCVLAIISPQSMQSKNAMDEISFALEQNKKVIPVLLTNTETTFRLRRLQRIDFTGEYEKGVNQLLKAIHISGSNSDTIIQDSNKVNTGNKNEFPEGFVFGKKITDSSDNISSKKPPSFAKRADQEDEIVSPQRLTTADLKNIIQEHLTISKETPHSRQPGNKKKILMGLVIFAVVVATAAVTWGILKNNNQQSDTKIVGEIHPTPNIIALSDSTQTTNKIKEDTTTEEKKQTPQITQPDPVIVTPSNKNKPISYNTSAENRKENNAKTTPDKKEELEHDKKAPVPVPDTPTKKEEIVPPKPPEKIAEPTTPKEMYINTEIVFDVVFERLPNMKEKRDYQPVKFVVTNPVVYNGITLINKGAIAEGEISLGSIHASMLMKHVVGANGQIIALKLKDGVRMRDIKLNYPYKVMIKKGIKLFF